MTTAYWLDEPYEPRPPLAGHVEVEACVIGAGVGGLRALAGWRSAGSRRSCSSATPWRAGRAGATAVS